MNPGAGRRWLRIACVVAATAFAGSCFATTLTKTRSVFFSAKHRAQAASNVQKYSWAAEIRNKAVADAEPFVKMSNEELWSLVFGSTIKRSWMVWSNGHCPSCKQSVPMYTWKIDALKRPWKVQCPHCSEIFPKNDFHAFYKSGLDAAGIFDPARGDRSLLFNADAGGDGPRRAFGVDDGDGYVDGEKRWRFIGAYLIYGQWKQLIMGATRKLAAAYAVTGDDRYAHKAGVLLDRIADVYPTFDFQQQGIIYDKPSTSAGYVSVWHDACSETRELVFAYDQVYDAIAKDAQLLEFLSQKAKASGLKNAKTTFADVQANIEGGILRDALANRPKIQSNFPYTDYTNAVILATLAWPHNRDEVYHLVDSTITTATSVDGVTGEKGLPGYASYATVGLGDMIGYFNRLDADFTKHALEKVPTLKNTYRFHIDTWALQKYYPNSGDGGNFAEMIRDYKGLAMTRDAGVGPSNYSLLWRLFKLLDDPAYAQVMYGANGNSAANIPYDVCAEDVDTMQKQVRDVVATEGARPKQQSVNYKGWCIGLLRSGAAEHERVLWLDYDSGGKHSHADGLSLGLYGYGIDLMPDFGYPPVQYGGWGAPRAQWYVSSPAHNTVVVDGENHVPGQGKTSLFANGKVLQAITATAGVSGTAGVFERTVAIVNVSDSKFYVLDFFRVGGGSRHQKFMHSHFGTITTTSETLKPFGDYLNNPHMRNWMQDTAQHGDQGWSIEWQIEDRMGARKTSEPLRLRYTDLTDRADRFVHEGWISYGGYNKNTEEWIPRLMIERKATTAGLESHFVSVIEPFEKESAIASIKRARLGEESTIASDSRVKLEVKLSDGRRDMIMFNPAGVQNEGGVSTDAKLSLVRESAAGKAEMIALCNGTHVTSAAAEVRLHAPAEIVEVAFTNDGSQVLTGDPANVVKTTAGAASP